LKWRKYFHIFSGRNKKLILERLLEKLKKTISMDLSEVTFGLEVGEGLSKEEILEMAKKQFIKEITKKFPFYKYNIVDGSTISKEEVQVGVPVKRLETEGKGIICDVNWANKFPISVALSKGRIIKCTLTAIDKLSKKTSIDKLIEGREDFMKSINEWSEGNTGYILVEGTKVIPIIFGKSKKKDTYKAFLVDHEANGQYYTLSSKQLKFIYDTKAEAESASK
jgi:hypothetical protein